MYTVFTWLIISVFVILFETRHFSACRPIVRCMTVEWRIQGGGRGDPAMGPFAVLGDLSA